MNIDISLIDTNPDQPRKEFLGLDELAESIKEHGLIQPVTVRAKNTPDGVRYTLVAGERRLLACKKLGMKHISAHVYAGSSDDVMAALVENIQRESLTVVEEGLAYQALIDDGKTVAWIAQMVDCGDATVRNRLAILDLEPETQAFMVKGEIPHGQDCVKALREVEPKDQVELVKRLAIKASVSGRPNVTTRSVKQAVVAIKKARQVEQRRDTKQQPKSNKKQEQKQVKKRKAK